MNNKELANRIAQEELGDLDWSLKILNQQLKQTIMFENIDMEEVKKSITNQIKGKYFEKSGLLKNEYVELFVKVYRDRNYQA